MTFGKATRQVLRENFQQFLVGALSFAIIVLLKTPFVPGIKRTTKKELKRILGSKLKKERAAKISPYWLAVSLALSLLLLLLSKNFQLVRVAYTYDGLKEVVPNLLIIPLTIVGLVIPFFALAAQIALSKKISQYGIQNSLRRLIIVSLIVTALFVSLLAVVNGASPLPESILAKFFTHWSLLIIAAAYCLVICLIAWSGTAIIRLIELFDETRATILVQDAIVKEGLKWLQDEMLSNLSFSILNKSFKKEDSISFSYFQPSGGNLIIPSTIGEVHDIKLFGLKFINNLVKKYSNEPKTTIKIIRPGYTVSQRDKQIAAIDGFKGSPILLTMITRVIKASIKIQPESQESTLQLTEDPLLTTLEAYKERLIKLLESSNSNLLMQALNAYGAFFDAYMNLGIKLKAEDSPSILGDWRPVTLIEHDLNEIIQISSSKTEGDSIGTIAHWVYEYLQRSFNQENEYVFSRLLRLLQTTYYYSLKYNNEIGANRAHKVPLDVLDYSILHFGDTEEVTVQNAEFRKNITHLIVKHLNLLLKISIDSNNLKKVTEILSILEPAELFPRTRDIAPYQKYELIIQLEHRSPTPIEARVLRDKIKVCEILENIINGYPDEFKKIIFAALSYLIERSKYNDLKPLEYKEVLSLLWKKTGGIDDTFSWLESQNIADRYYESIWEYFPKTRGVFSKDPMRVPLTLLSLKLAEQQKSSADLIVLPPSRIIHNFKDRIIPIITSLVQGSDLNIVIGEVEESIQSKLVQSLVSADDNYKQKVEESIINAEIDGGLVASLRNKFVEGYRDGGALRNILSNNASFTIEESRQLTETIKITIYQDKDAVIAQDRISYSDWGGHIGQALANKSDLFILEQIESLSDKESITISSLPEGLDQYIASKSLSEKNSLKLFLPFFINARKDLWSSGKFTAAFQLPSQDNALFGEFDGVKVYTLEIRNKNFAVIGDFSQLNIRETGLEFSVNNLSAAEIRDIMQRETGATENKLKQKVKIEVSVKLNLQIRTDFIPCLIYYETESPE